MVETLDGWIRAVGPLGYAALFAASLIEYVFPPFPGDTVVLLGGIFAVRGQRSWVLVLATVTLGSVLGAAINYFVGSRLARQFEKREDFAERHPHLVRLQSKMRDRGIPLIAFNRFLPGVRGLIFLAAGASAMDFRRVMAWGALSALLWNALILAVGIAVGGNAERLERFVQDYNRVAWVAMVAAVAAFAAWCLYKKARPAPR
jgi:membrane protein DedA with SNARE-associated domain